MAYATSSPTPHPYMSSSSSPPAPSSSSSFGSPSPSPSPSPTGQPLLLLEDGWRLIQTQGLDKLHAIIKQGTLRTGGGGGVQGFTNEEYARLYTIIYQMCIQKAPHCWTPQLYERYDQSISQYLQHTSLPAILCESGPYLIREVVRRWEDHLLMRKWMYDFFRYIDRFYVKRHGKKPLNEVAVARFRQIVFDAVKQRLTAALLDAMRRDRNGEEVDREAMHAAIHIYVELGAGSLRLYQLEFERPFLEESRQYYAIQAAKWIQTDSCPEYLRKCEKRFQEEKKRVEQVLVQHTEAPLMQVLNETLLLSHQRELLEKEHTGVRALLRSHAEGDLGRLYSLYSGIPSSLPFIANIVKQHIVDLGKELLDGMNGGGAAPTSTAAPAATASSTASSFTPSTLPSTAPSGSRYIDSLMSMHHTYFELVRHAFHGHATFQKAMKEAFETIINQPVGGAGTGEDASSRRSTAELLASYADDLLRKGGMQLEGAQLERTLDSIVRLFAYLSDKDLFGEFYRKQLATRLLTQRSASSDAEKSMIGKLKLSMGAQFTSRLEGMFNDMRNAAEHQADFVAFVQQRGLDLKGVEFSVQTLTTGFWPSYPLDELTLPPVLQGCVDAFRLFYDSRTNNRKLRWIHDLGVVTLAAHFTKRKVELVASTVQAAVLLQFNEAAAQATAGQEGEGLTIDTLIHRTGLSPEVMKQTLKSLVNGKAKILVKVPSEGYSTKHRMRVNYAFTSPQYRVRLPVTQRKTSPKERESTSMHVAESRKHAMDSNIVRIMKARKSIHHQQLMAEVSQQLMQFFQPDPRQIKQRIEDLIQREYMKRDEEQSNVYHYLA